MKFDRVTSYSRSHPKAFGFIVFIITTPSLFACGILILPWSRISGDNDPHGIATGFAIFALLLASPIIGLILAMTGTFVMKARAKSRIP